MGVGSRHILHNMHIPIITKIESILDQVSRWYFLQGLIDTILPHLDQHQESAPLDSPTFVPTRSTQVRLHPNTTISLRGHVPHRSGTQKALFIAIVGLAIISSGTNFLFISIHTKQMKSLHFAIATPDQSKRRIIGTSLREKRLSSSNYTGFAAIIKLCSCLLWAFGAMHATSRLLWILIRNMSYTVVRWALKHPSAMMAAASNLFFGFDIFDALFRDIISLHRYKNRPPHFKNVFQNAMNGILWLPTLTFGALKTLSTRLLFQAVSGIRGFARRRFGLYVLAVEEARDFNVIPKPRESTRPQLERPWLPIELPTRNPAQLDANNIVEMKRIARSGFGRLYEARDAGCGRILAVKRVNKKMLGEKGEPLLLDEIRAYHRMDSDSRFPSLLGCFLDQNDYILVMPYYPRGDLLSLMKDSGGFLKRGLARFYCAELFLAIRSLHKARIIHGDLKPGNILLDENRHLVITDFGLATVFSKDRERGRDYPLWRDAKKRGGSHFPPLWPNGNPHTICRAAGTEVYAAPEVFSKHPFSYGVDYWSMGVIYHEMVTGQLPYDTTWKNGIRHVFHPLTINLRQQSQHLQLLDTLSLHFITQVLSAASESRPNVREMKRDRMWCKINWKAMRRKELEVPSP